MKSVQAVDQTPSRRLHDVIIIKMEARSGFGLRDYIAICHIGELHCKRPFHINITVEVATLLL